MNLICPHIPTGKCLVTNEDVEVCYHCVPHKETAECSLDLEICPACKPFSSFISREEMELL